MIGRLSPKLGVFPIQIYKIEPICENHLKGNIKNFLDRPGFLHTCLKLLLQVFLERFIEERKWNLTNI